MHEPHSIHWSLLLEKSVSGCSTIGGYIIHKSLKSIKILQLGGFLSNVELSPNVRGS